MQRNIKLLVPLLLLCLLLNGCGAPAVSIGSASLQVIKPSAVPSADFIPYKAPPMPSVEYHPELAEGNSQVKIDLSSVSEGYFAASATSDKRLKLQVLFDDLTYTYDISSDGTPSFFPLQCGNGLYAFRFMENISESKYAQIYRTECKVSLLDEFQPFIRTSNYSRYDENSECVKKAAEMAATCSGKMELITAVYSFVCKNIRYDDVKAATVQSGYMPDVDETLRTKKGICFDYASLAAAMLRSQGIPTKIIFGYVAPANLFHAWNMFYSEESGWITVSFEVKGDVWTRMDLTFSAGGASAKFIGDGSHYTDVYSY